MQDWSVCRYHKTKSANTLSDEIKKSKFRIEPQLNFRLPELGWFFRPIFGIEFGTFLEMEKTRFDRLSER